METNRLVKVAKVLLEKSASEKAKGAAEAVGGIGLGVGGVRLADRMYNTGRNLRRVRNHELADAVWARDVEGIHSAMRKVNRAGLRMSGAKAVAGAGLLAGAGLMAKAVNTLQKK